MTNSNHPVRRRKAVPPKGDETQSTAPRHAKKPKTAGAVSPTVARQIDENLKRLYAQHVEQELPPDLQALVARLRDGDEPRDTVADSDDEGC